MRPVLTSQMVHVTLPGDNYRKYTWLCVAFAGLFFLFSIASFLILRIVEGVVTLALAMLFTAVTVEMIRRRKDIQHCQFCGGPLRLHAIRGRDDDPYDDYHEFFFRCTRCGKERVIVDA